MAKTKSYDTEFHVINHITWSSKKKFGTNIAQYIPNLHAF